MDEITTITRDNAAAFVPWVPAALLRRAVDGPAMAGLGAVDAAGASCGALVMEGVGNTAFVRHLDADLSASPDSPAAPAIALVKGACRVAKESNLVFMEAVVCEDDPAAHTALQSAYTVNGFSARPAPGCQFSLDLGALLADEGLNLKKGTTLSHRLRVMVDRPERQLRRLNTLLKKHNHIYLPLPLTFEDFMPEYSVVSLDAADRMDGALLFGQPDRDGFSLTGLAIDRRAPVRHAKELIAAAVELIRRNPGPYTTIYVSAVTETSEKLVRRLAGKAIREETEACTLRKALYAKDGPPWDLAKAAMQVLQETEEDLEWTS